MLTRSTMICGAVLFTAAQVNAGFTVTMSLLGTQDGFDRYSIVATNTGGDTGTQIKGLEYFYQGSPAFFQVDDLSDQAGGDPDGIADTVNLLSASRTRIRVSTNPASNVFVGVTPTNAFAQPNPYLAGVTSFSGAIANTGVTYATGAGFEIARLYIQAGGFGVLSGNIGGDIGQKVPFGNFGPNNHPPVITTPNASANVVFDSVVTDNAPFSVQIGAVDIDNDLLNLVLGTLPTALSNVTVSPATSASPALFTVSGTVDFSAAGTTIVVPYTVFDNGGVRALGTPGEFRLVVTPEPCAWTIAVFGLRPARRRNG